MSGKICARVQARPIIRLRRALFFVLAINISAPVPAAVGPDSVAVEPGPAAVETGTAVPQEEMPAPGIERLVARVQERLLQADDLQARFAQRRLSRFGSVLVEREGKLYIQPPGRMRMEYDQPPDLWVSAGDDAYWYLANDHQVQVLRTEGTEASELPIMYLAGKGDLLRDFDIEEMEWGPKLAPGNIQLQMRPHREDASFTFLVLEVEPMTATIARLVNVDRINNSIDYQFHDIEYDVGLSDGLFEFEIPQGADVVYLGG